ncbi:MAG TPA: TonB-dependent receptor, partial [Polyangiaceae bacterium]|nr:TonB-dependent receptor [Polyangiaceae bacterium]
PNDDVSLLVTADVADLGGKGPIGIRIGEADPHTDNPWRDKGASAPQGLPSYLSPVPWAGDLLVPKNDGFIDTKLWNASAQLDWNLHWATLTVIPAYRNMKSETHTYQPGFLFQNHETSDQSSFEARLGNSTESLKWVGGAYYFKEHQAQNYFVDQGVNTTAVDTPTLDTKSWAAFGEATYSVSPQLRAILGLRYTHEEKEQAGTQENLFPYPTFVWTYVLGGNGPAPFLLPGAVTGQTSANKTTWKGGLEYDLTPENMLFFTASEGFKAGGVFPTKFADPTYKPEELRAFELGSRNRFLNNRLQLNFEGFYWKYRDKQEASVRFDSVEGVNFIIRNASKATMYGANVELAWQATAHDRIDLGVEYLHSQYDDFTYVLNSGGTTGCLETPRPDGNVTIDCTGEQLPKAPTWSGNLGYSHVFDLPNGGGITAAAHGQFSSSTFQDITYAPTGRMGSWTIVDADLTYDSPESKWSVTAWIRNIGDKAVYTGGSLYPFTPGVYYATIRPPRTFGLRAAVNF